jgi:membrane-bound ClpP family serine protease
MAKVTKVDLDKVGACASAACAVHCLLTGVAMSLLSVLGLGFFGSIWTDLAFLMIASVVGFMAIRQGYRHHLSYWPGAIFVLGMAAMVVSHFALGHEHGHGATHNPHSLEVASTAIAVSGGLMLVTFHVVNAVLIRRRRRAASG